VPCPNPLSLSSNHEISRITLGYRWSSVEFLSPLGFCAACVGHAANRTTN